MRIDRGQRGWMVATLLLLGAAAVGYVATARDPLAPVSGGSLAGLVFGGAGMACMVAAALLTLRKRLKTWRLGRTSRWMAAHVWLGLLSLPLILCHGGFRFGGSLTTWLMVLLIACWISGVVGLILQQVLPRLMTEQVPHETIYEQIDHVLGLLRDEARALVEAAAGPIDPPAVAAAPATPARKPPEPKPGSGPIRDFFVEQAQPWLAARRPAGSVFDQPSTSQVRRSHLKRLVPAELHEVVDDLFEICEERRQIEKQRRLHLWLHGWLFVHVPVSWALLAGAAFHAVLALKF
jgi:hypothetical protein